MIAFAFTPAAIRILAKVCRHSWRPIGSSLWVPETRVRSLSAVSFAAGVRLAVWVAVLTGGGSGVVRARVRAVLGSRRPWCGGCGAGGG